MAFYNVSEMPVAIVTGAARGIGFAVTLKLLESGYRISMIDSEEKHLKAAASDLQKRFGSKRISFRRCDVTLRQEFEAAFDWTASYFGRIDLLINNAGILNERLPDRMVAVNLMGPIYGCELALQYMGKSNNGRGGIVINVSCASGFVPYADTPNYVATKHGLIGLTRSYGHQCHFEKNEVTFMAVCPNYTNTPLLMEAETLGLYNNVYIDTVSTRTVANKIEEVLLRDKVNGSTLIVLNSGAEYVEIQEDLKRIQNALM